MIILAKQQLFEGMGSELNSFENIGKKLDREKEW